MEHVKFKIGVNGDSADFISSFGWRKKRTGIVNKERSYWREAEQTGTLEHVVQKKKRESRVTNGCNPAKRRKVRCERRMSTAGALSAALLMVRLDDGWRGHALRELLPCHRLSARLCF